MGARMPDSIGARVARLDERLNSMDRTLAGILEALKDQNQTSSAYRSAMRDELGKLVMRTTQLEVDAGTIRRRIEDMEAVTVEVTTLRTKAEGAGTLGRWLVRIGIGVVTLAGWIVGVYTYLTGRPPP